MAGRKFGNNIDLNSNQLLNALLQLIAGNPGSPLEGQIWYDSTAKKLKFRSNTANVDPTDRAQHTGTQLRVAADCGPSTALRRGHGSRLCPSAKSGPDSEV